MRSTSLSPNQHAPYTVLLLSQIYRGMLQFSSVRGSSGVLENSWCLETRMMWQKQFLPNNVYCQILICFLVSPVMLVFVFQSVLSKDYSFYHNPWGEQVVSMVGRVLQGCWWGLFLGSEELCCRRCQFAMLEAKQVISHSQPSMPLPGKSSP